MASPFAAPAESSGVKWDDLNGALLIFTVHAVEEGIPTTFGDKDAVRADVDVVDGPKAGERYPDALVFGLVLIGQLRPNVGSKVLGRLGQGNAKPGQKPPWLLAEATEQDTNAATAHLNKQFAAPTADAGAAEAAPPF